MNEETYLTSNIIRPDSNSYNSARTNFNTHFSKYPCIIAFCESVSDVRKVIKYARKQELPIRIRGGRHCFEAFSLIDGGMIIDLSKMKKVYIDKIKNVAVVQAGIANNTLYKALWEEGLTIPSGTRPTVGVAGLTLGGGIGMLSRKLGLTCDNLLEVEMVDANGEVIYANNEENCDLFWASRGGGGGNFGIITSLSFKAYPISDVSIYKIYWDWMDIEAVIDAWQRWAPYTDNNLTCELQSMSKEAGVIISDGQFVGPKEKLSKLLQTLLEAGHPQRVKIETVPYIEAVQMFAGNTEPHKFKNTGAFVYKSLPLKALDVIRYFLEHTPNDKSSIWSQSLGGAVNTIPPNATAFFHRDAKFIIQYITFWEEDCEAGENICWANEFRKAMLPFSVGDYVNFADENILNWPKAYYGTNFDKLRKIKSKYDPENIFVFPQSIPPEELFV